MKIVLPLVFLPLIFLGQLTVINPSFEGTPGMNSTPDPWGICMPGLTSDTHPGPGAGYACVNLPPTDGDTYLGFVHGNNGGIGAWQEGASQELSSPMIANGCPYVFTIDLAGFIICETGMLDPGNAELLVYGGFMMCPQLELLDSTGDIPDSLWTEYQIEFTPEQNYTHIMLQINSIVEGEKNYILLDNMSPIINSVPINISTSSVDFCVGESFPIEATYETNECTPWEDSECDRTWTASGPGNVIFSNNSINNPSVIVDEYGVYTFTYSHDCAGTQSFVVEVTTPSVPIDISTSSLVNVCIGESFLIEATYEDLIECVDETECDQTWTASGPGNVMFSNSSINNPSVIVDAYGIYTFTYTNNCAGTQSLPIEITPPIVSIDSPENIYCLLEAQLSASSSVSGEGSWTTNSNNSIVVPGLGNTATLFVNEYGSYDVEYTNCDASDVVTVEFEPFDPYITSSSPAACENSIELSIVTTDPIIFWEQISGPTIAEISDLNAESTQVTVSEFGIYTFGVSSCDTLVTLDVAIGIPCPLEIPNAFSPNGDGVNDFFEIPGLNAYTYNSSVFQVYNRWGERIYVNMTYGIDGVWWNGQAVNSNTQNQISTLPLIGSTQVSDGTYYYTLELEHITEEYPMESYFGFITVF